MRVPSIIESAIRQDLRDGLCPDDCPWLDEDEECEYCDYLEVIKNDEGDRRHDEKMDRELED